MGLYAKHQVQNGLLLCANCHCEFGALLRYVDVIVEENGNYRYALKIVKGIRETEDDLMDYDIAVRKIKGIREIRKTRWPARDINISDDEMSLWFISPFEDVQNDDHTSSECTVQPGDLRPNIKALELHKTACLIWRMAGGAQEEDDYCSEYDSFLEQEDIYYDKRTEDFVTATVAALEESLSRPAFQQSLLEHADIISPQ